jgi:hypothetical protein
LQGFYDFLAILHGVILAEHAVFIGFYTFSGTTTLGRGTSDLVPQSKIEKFPLPSPTFSQAPIVTDLSDITLLEQMSSSEETISVF